jgi:hypothetical protein
MSGNAGDEFYNRVGGDRISSRQIDELIGIARGLTADRKINQPEVEFLQKWEPRTASLVLRPAVS